MEWKYIKYFSILFFILSTSALGEHGLHTESGSYPLKNKKYGIFPAGTEFYFLYLEEFKDDIWAYTYILNKDINHKYAWIPVVRERNKFHFYATDKEQSYQTLNLKDTVYIRNHTKIGAYLDNKRLKPKNIHQYTSRYSDVFPITLSTDNKEKMLKSNEIKVCPQHPKKLSNKFCSHIPKRYKLPKHLIKAVQNTAKKFKIDPALLASIIHKESEFNPFSENKYEKKLCLDKKRRGERCADYLWGQGLAQLGANNAKNYGMLWVNKMPRLKSCGKRHIFYSKCFYSLESFCRKKYKKYKLWPNYCPRAGMRSIAQHIHYILNREHKILANSKNEKGRKIIDLMKHIKRNKAEKFRYVIAIYNRGMKPINSLEEHYRQHGKLPIWYDHAWNTKRELGKTPSSEIGFLLLHNQVINRCHVWQLAGLCGKNLSNTLIGQYTKYFKSRRIATQNNP